MSQPVIYEPGNLILYIEDKKIRYAWTNNGLRVLYIKESEQYLDKRGFQKIIEAEEANNHYRCSRCGTKLNKEEGHYHIFNEIVCDMCHIFYEEKAKKEIRKKQICKECQKPYSKCSC